ncbi:winged helix-turn-helix transcriptional regulator [Clostridium sp. Marseille-P299]|uniref:winged helix-turn-helix transcriptional regulator n=1 Tax=Clostridium sp. Marseille-P299 TaxID=1805477 RepID=UPI00082BF714|nr:helix-turn-helix domain-containing protein [Clostridium sp. Marseille-P299]
MNKKEVNIKPFAYAMSLTGGKWKMHILFWLRSREVMRYSELKRALEGVTHKMLSNQLKELEKDGLIIRNEYTQVPPKVEYSLSELGKSLMPILHEICLWGHQHIDEHIEGQINSSTHDTNF